MVITAVFMGSGTFYQYHQYHTFKGLFKDINYKEELSVTSTNDFRIFWTIFITLSFLGLFYILKQADQLFREKVVSYVPQTTYLRWKVDFPAISVCEAPDNDKLADYYEELDTF